jgi:hypothetical protein
MPKPRAGPRPGPSPCARRPPRSRHRPTPPWPQGQGPEGPGFCLKLIYFREPELTFLSRTDAPSLLRPTEGPGLVFFLHHLFYTEPVLPFQTTTDAPLLLRPRRRPWPGGVYKIENSPPVPRRHISNLVVMHEGRGCFFFYLLCSIIKSK